MSYKDLVNRELTLAKHRSDFFSRWLGLPISLPITRLFLHFELSENLATLLVWIAGIVGATLMLFDGIGRTVGLALMVLHYILDYVDGQLARERKTVSVLGSVMDRWNHLTVQMTFYFMLGFGLYLEHQTSLVFIAAFLLIFWNSFRNLIANMPALIYVNQFHCWHHSESKIIYENYIKTLGSMRNDDASKSRPYSTDDNKPKSTFRSTLFQLRSTSTSFDFFTMSLLVVSLVNPILNSFLVEWDFFLLAVYLFALYYLINIIDYSKQYLFSDQIYKAIAALEGKFRSSK